MQVELSKYYLDKCKKFAKDRIKDSNQLYKWRGETNKDKMIEDCVIGTMGEWGAYKYLESKGIKTTKPDMKIYEKKRKSFAGDLISDDYVFHVKSQSVVSNKRYGASWLLQRRDKVVSNPAENEYFILTKVVDRYVEILAIIRCKDIADACLWGECKVPRYRHSKVALYLDDLNSIDLWRF